MVICRTFSTLPLAAVLLAGMISCSQAEEESPVERPKVTTVDLVIDYGDHSQKKFTAIPCEDGTTVLDVLNHAEKHPRGISFQSKGNGKLAFLTQIDDLKNERGGGRNWIFYVGDKRGDSSFGVAKVPPGATILWRFEEYK